MGEQEEGQGDTRLQLVAFRIPEDLIRRVRRIRAHRELQGRKIEYKQLYAELIRDSVVEYEKKHGLGSIDQPAQPPKRRKL